jgi:hypothetical protein
MSQREVLTPAEIEGREYLTRPEICAFLTARGFQIGRSTIDKLSMQSRGRNDGPPIAGQWGSRHLYRPADV